MHSNERILNLVCRYYGVSVEEVKSSSRETGLVLPRHITMYILKKDFGLNDGEIGYELDRKRGAVYNGIMQIENIKTYDKELLLDLINIRTFIQHPSTFHPKKVKISNNELSEEVKKIYQYDLDMNEIDVFDNIDDAVYVTGVSYSTITRAISEYKKKGRGFYWVKK